ncbi:MAG: CDP-alcohol phosphatidyltransferase family protein [Candidatus Hadarchaeales archaeon]
MKLLNRLRKSAQRVIDPIGRVISRSGISPNALTCLGLAFSAAAAYLFWQGYQLLAGLALLVGGVFDILDGAVARASGRTTNFGGFFDSTVDRYADLLIFSGIILGFRSGRIAEESFMTGLGVPIGLVALSGSLMVSYVRARAESAGSGRLDVGIMERAERLIILGIGALLSLTGYSIVIIAVLTHITVIHRIIVARRRLG